MAGGGYCFERNLVFGHVLRGAGEDAPLRLRLVEALERGAALTVRAERMILPRTARPRPCGRHARASHFTLLASTLTMQALQDKTIVVAGGTGNVGAFIVRALLERGAVVAVPSRSEQKVDALRAYLSHHVGETDLGRLYMFVGDLKDEAGAAALRRQITSRSGAPHAALAALGQWHSVPSLLSARAADLERVLQGYLIAHHMAARTFLPDLKVRGGTYVFINGPLAFDVWGPETTLVSVATAAQHMLFRALALELEESPAQVAELVTHAFIRNRETQPSSPLPGEAVGAYAAHLLSGAAGRIHGQSIHLRSPEPLEEAGLVI